MKTRIFIVIWCLAASAFAQTASSPADSSFELLAVGQERLCLGKAAAQMAILGNKMSKTLAADMQWGQSAECLCMPKKLRAARRGDFPDWYAESHLRLEQWGEECRIQTFREYVPLMCVAYASEHPSRIDLSVCGCLGSRASSMSMSEARSLMMTYLSSYPQPDSALFGEFQSRCESTVRGTP